MTSNESATTTSLTSHLRMLGVSPLCHYQETLGQQLSSSQNVWYFQGLKDILSTINIAMAEENAHLLAFDIYLCKIFARHDIYTSHSVPELKEFLYIISNNDDFPYADDTFQYYREAFMLAARIVAYLYQDKIIDSSNFLFVDKYFSFEMVKGIITKGSGRIGRKKAYTSIIERLNQTASSNDSYHEKSIDRGHDNYLHVLSKKFGLGITDKFLTNGNILCPPESSSPSDFENEVFASKRKTHQIVLYNDKIDGIRKLFFQQDIFNLLPSQYAFLNDKKLFSYLLSTHELLTYNIPASVVSDKNILVSFIDVVNMSSEMFQLPVDTYHIFPNSLPKKIHLKTLYEFFLLKQSKLLQPIFEDHFDFTYRFVHLGQQGNPPEDIKETDFAWILEDDTPYEIFRAELLLAYPGFFYYDHFHRNTLIKERLEERFKRMLKEKQFNLYITILFLQGEVSPVLQYSLRKFVSEKHHIILIDSTNEHLQFEVGRLKRQNTSTVREIVHVPFYVALEAIKAILMV